MSDNKYVNIRVTVTLRDVLKGIGTKAQTYDDIIWGLVQSWNEGPKIEGRAIIEPLSRSGRVPNNSRKQ